MLRSSTRMESPFPASMPRASWSAGSSGSTIPAAPDSPTAPSSGASPGKAQLLRLRRADLDADRDAVCVVREADRRAGDELRAVSRDQLGDRGVLRHRNVLHAAVVGERELAAAGPASYRLHDRAYGGIGHGLIIAAVERPVSRVQHLRKAAHLERGERAIGAPRRGDAEEIARLDLGERDRPRENDVGLLCDAYQKAFPLGLPPRSQAAAEPGDVPPPSPRALPT